MDAKSLLISVARNLREQGLEAILIGNAAAALQGAPVTTVDLDFLMRKTAASLRKLERIADAMGAVVFTPYYPVSGLYRLIRDDDQMQLDFMTRIHGVSSFNSLRSRAVLVEIGDEAMTVAALADIISSKRAADRPRDRAVMHALEEALKQKSVQAGGSRSTEASKRTRPPRPGSATAGQTDE